MVAAHAEYQMCAAAQSACALPFNKDTADEAASVSLCHSCALLFTGRELGVTFAREVLAKLCFFTKMWGTRDCFCFLVPSVFDGNR